LRPFLVREVPDITSRKAGFLMVFETYAMPCHGREMYSCARNRRGEIVMIEMVSRWGNNALMITFLLITYAVVITLR
jgi:hypothetical protein